MPNKPRVLIIDDDPSVCYSFRKVVAKQQYDVETAHNVSDGIEIFPTFQPDVVVLDLNLPDGSGMDAFYRIRNFDHKCPVLFITAHGTTETALEAMKEGAFDYLVKPVDLDRLGTLLERAVEAAKFMRHPSLLPAQEGNDRIVGHSQLIQETCKSIGLLAPQEVNVLILGESGVGKELVARALYQHSRRNDRPFLAINCAALPEHLLESELFGHEQGSFTGAHRQRIGKFEQCKDGTLFLDEIGDMTPPVQAKMLRVLQDQRFERIGGTKPIQTNVRILAATNQDLQKLVAEGRFRADLYYRLSVTTVSVPALRDRPEDIAEIASHFLFTNNRTLQLSLHGFSESAMDCLEKYDWPGNVRQLQSVVKESMVRTRGPMILPEYLPDYLRGPNLESSGEAGAGDIEGMIANLLQKEETDLYSKVIQAVDRVVIQEVMRRTQGNQLRASEILGIDRKTLRHKLRALHLTTNKILVDNP